MESALHQEYSYVCEREREAAIRNMQLIEDLAKLRQKISKHEGRSQRLAQLKVRVTEKRFDYCFYEI